MADVKKDRGGKGGSEASLHVVTNLEGRWSVTRSGASRATRVFATQDDAIRFARKFVTPKGGDLYIHRRDGRISEKTTYGTAAAQKRG